MNNPSYTVTISNTSNTAGVAGNPNGYHVNLYPPTPMCTCHQNWYSVTPQPPCPVHAGPHAQSFPYLPDWPDYWPDDEPEPTVEEMIADLQEIVEDLS